MTPGIKTVTVSTPNRIQPHAWCSSTSSPSPSPEGLTPQGDEGDRWVQLLALPNPYAFEAALLLCQHSEEEWVAWVPDHGEIILHREQFY